MKYSVIDVETTGLNVARGGRVIEVGAVAVENGLLVAEFDALINVAVPVSYGAFSVHGISQQMLEDQAQPQDVWPAFREFVGDGMLVAHNAPFDRAFVCHELARLGIGLPNSWNCTLRLARQKLPHLPNHKLDTVYRHLFGSLPQSARRHRALDDAWIAAMIWVKLQGKH